MSPLDGHRRRRRTDAPDPAMRLVIVLSLIVGLLTVVSTTVAVTSLVRLSVQQGQIKENFHNAQTSRVVSSRAFCNAINANAIAANRQTDYLRGLVVNSAKQSKVFDHFYREAGAPPYAERLKKAQKIAESLNGRRIPALDCDRFVEAIRRNVPPSR